MKKNITSLFLILFIISISACSYRREAPINIHDNTDTAIQNTALETEAAFSNLPIDEIDTEAVSDSPDYPRPDKIVTWLVTDLVNVSDHTLNEFNRLLTEDGCDFSLELITIPYNQYDEQLMDYLQSLNAPGLVMCGAQNYSTAVDIVDQSYLMPLDSYLASDNSGKFYQMYDPLTWDSVRYNDHLYTVPNAINQPLPLSFIFNTNYIPDSVTEAFDGSIEWIYEILINLPPEDNFSPLAFYTDISVLGTLTGSQYMYHFLLPYASQIPLSLLDYDETINLYFLLHQLYLEGYISDEMSLITPPATDLASFLQSGQYYITITCDLITDSMLPANAYHIQSETVITSQLAGSIGIPALAQFPDEAFQLLTLLHTDSRYANLLAYGVEDLDSIQSAAGSQTTDRFINASFGNRYSFGLPSPVTAQINSTLVPSPYLGFHFDPGPVQDQIIAYEQAILPFLDLWKTTDFESQMEYAYAVLNISDLDVILNECQSQYLKYLASTPDSSD